MDKNEYEVWTEGYAATGERGVAIFHGKFKGNSFKEAVIEFRDSLTNKHSISCINIEQMTFWACRFFDNEADARKSFG